jgi:predicted nuclease of predicted toxin-antitoxin system
MWIGQRGRCGDLGICQNNGFTIVSKDSDFEERTILLGFPPKLIWVRASNCTSAQVESLLRAAFSSVKRFVQEDEETCLILGPRHGNK